MRNPALTKPQAKRFEKTVPGFASSLPSRSQGFWRSRAQALAGVLSSQNRHPGMLLLRAAPPFLPLHFHGFVCVYLRAPTSQPGKQLLAQEGFSPATALPFGSRSQQHQCTGQHKACGRAGAGQCSGREGTSQPTRAGRTGVQHQTTLPSCSFSSNSVSEEFCCILTLCFPPAK